MKIIGISGSLRQDSYNTGLLRTASLLLPPEVDFEVLDISVFPLYNSDIERKGLTDAISVAEHAIADADGVLFATPEYNYSYSGVLKNAIDWISRPPLSALSEKPVAVIGASPGRYGTARGQMNLSQLLHSINAHVLPKPELLVTDASSKFDKNRILIDEATLHVYQTLLNKFTDYISIFQTTEETV